MYDRRRRDPERRVFLWRLDDHREGEIARPIELTPIQGRCLRRLNAMKAKDLLGQTLVPGEQQAGGTRAGVVEAEEIEQRRDVRFQGALSAERLGDIENDVRSSIPQRCDDLLDLTVHDHAFHVVLEHA
jgi:hypothetical protein